MVEAGRALSIRPPQKERSERLLIDRFNREIEILRLRGLI